VALRNEDLAYAVGDRLGGIQIGEPRADVFIVRRFSIRAEPDPHDAIIRITPHPLPGGGDGADRFQLRPLGFSPKEVIQGLAQLFEIVVRQQVLKRQKLVGSPKSLHVGNGAGGNLGQERIEVDQQGDGRRGRRGV